MCVIPLSIGLLDPHSLSLWKQEAQIPKLATKSDGHSDPYVVSLWGKGDDRNSAGVFNIK